MTEAPQVKATIKTATLSDEQAEILIYLIKSIEEDPNGRSPKLRMIGMDIGCGLSTAWEHTVNLRKLGCLSGESDRTRRLKVTELGHATAESIIRKRLVLAEPKVEVVHESTEPQVIETPQVEAKSKGATTNAEAKPTTAVTAKKPLQGKKAAVAVKPASGSVKTSKSQVKPKVRRKSTGN